MTICMLRITLVVIVVMAGCGRQFDPSETKSVYDTRTPPIAFITSNYTPYEYIDVDVAPFFTENGDTTVWYGLSSNLDDILYKSWVYVDSCEEDLFETVEKVVDGKVFTIRYELSSDHRCTVVVEHRYFDYDFE